MTRIDTFLESYGLSLSECHPDWIDMVEEYNELRSALPEAVREEKEKAIISSFSNYHDITIEEPEKKPVTPKKKNPVRVSKVQDHEIDSSLIDRAKSFSDLL